MVMKILFLIFTITLSLTAQTADSLYIFKYPSLTQDTLINFNNGFAMIESYGTDSERMPFEKTHHKSLTKIAHTGLKQFYAYRAPRQIILASTIYGCPEKPKWKLTGVSKLRYYDGNGKWIYIADVAIPCGLSYKGDE